MDKAFINWMVGEGKMLCACHSFMSPKGALKELLLRQIELPFAKLCFYKVSRGLKNTVFEESKANICSADIIYQWKFGELLSFAYI